MIIFLSGPCDEYGYEDEASGMEGFRRAAALHRFKQPQSPGHPPLSEGAVLLLRLFVSLDWSIILPVLLVLAGIALGVWAGAKAETTPFLLWG